MPIWVKLLLLSLGVVFMAVGALVGVVGTRHAQAHVALVEGLRPLSAAALEDQPAGADVLVEGVVSARNPEVFRNFVAYVREEYEVKRDSDGDSTSSWESAGRETPRLLVEADGIVSVGNQNYSIERAHEVWYDEATMGWNNQPRDGSERYHGLVARGPVTVFGTAVDGPEGKALNAKALFGGDRDQYLAAQRQSAAFMPIFGAIFGVIGAVLAALSALFFFRR